MERKSGMPDSVLTPAPPKKAMALDSECGKFYGLDFILNGSGVPRCTCGGTVKPDVVLYEEGDGFGFRRPGL